jgi:hypothetical protein
MDDLGNLVRKARTDFGAEIRFLGEPELRQRLDERQLEAIGTLRDLGFDDGVGPAGAAGAASTATLVPTRYAALARVHYADTDETSLLLVLRPAVIGPESLEVRNYHEQAPRLSESVARQSVLRRGAVGVVPEAGRAHGARGVAGHRPSRRDGGRRLGAFPDARSGTRGVGAAPLV